MVIRELKINDSIKDLDNFCKFNGWSINFNRDRLLCGFCKGDYRVLSCVGVVS